MARAKAKATVVKAKPAKTKPKANAVKPKATKPANAKATKPASSKATKPAKGSIAERLQVPPDYSRALVAKQLAKVRALCTSLPDSYEETSHGSPSFFVGKQRQFASFLDNHHGDGRLALWCAAPDGMQAALIENDPDVYFVPPYVGHRGWVGIRLDREAAWPQIAGVVESAHQHRFVPAKRR